MALVNKKGWQKILFVAVGIIGLASIAWYFSNAPHRKVDAFRKEVKAFNMPGGKVIFESVTTRGCVEGDTPTISGTCYMDGEKDFISSSDIKTSLTALVQYIQSKGYSLGRDQKRTYDYDITHDLFAELFQTRPYSIGFESTDLTKTLDIEIGSKKAVVTQKNELSPVIRNLDISTTIYSVRFIQ